MLYSDESRITANTRARKCLVNALMELLETKSLSAITITELTLRAGVSRMTYYRNYSSKDEIFSSYLSDILDSYSKDVLHCYSYFHTHKNIHPLSVKMWHGRSSAESCDRLHCGHLL